MGVRGDLGVANLGRSSLESRVAMHGSVANRCLPLDGVEVDVDESPADRGVDTVDDEDEEPGKKTEPAEEGRGELLPAITANCSILRPRI